MNGFSFSVKPEGKVVPPSPGPVESLPLQAKTDSATVVIIRERSNDTVPPGREWESAER
jgi:hypothetical protein